MTQRQTFFKDPDVSDRFTIDWTYWLDGETISSVTWTLDSGLTEVSKTNTTLKATVTVSGGTAGTTYKIVCQVTSSAGRSEQQTLYIEVREK